VAQADQLEAPIVFQRFVKIEDKVAGDPENLAHACVPQLVEEKGMKRGRHGPRLPNATHLADWSWYINCDYQLNRDEMPTFRHWMTPALNAKTEQSERVYGP
jgi:hypothetical protein